MRDPARIDVILAKLAEVWRAHPDLRLGQLVENARRMSGSRADVFSVEDDVMFKGLEVWGRRE